MPAGLTIPDSIRVLAYDIEVTTPPPIEMDHNEVEGRFLLTGQRIEIRSDRPPMLIRETVLHELLHAVLAISGTRAVMEMDTDYEESMIAVLSPALLCVLRDNPALMDFLLGLVQQVKDDPAAQDQQGRQRGAEC